MCAHVTDAAFAFSSRNSASTRSMLSAVAGSASPPLAAAPPPVLPEAAALPLRRASSSFSRPSVRRAADARCLASRA